MTHPEWHHAAAGGIYRVLMDYFEVDISDLPSDQLTAVIAHVEAAIRATCLDCWRGWEHET